MQKKQIANVLVIALAIFFIGASVASSKIKTLKKIGSGSITNPYIGNDAVNSAKIQDGTVSSSDLADNSVTTGKIADGQVTADDIADGTVANADLGDNSVSSNKIQDGAIANADVSGSAGISGTKVSPNFGSQNLSTSGTGSFGSLWSNTLDSQSSGTDLNIGETYPGAGTGGYVDIHSPFYADQNVLLTGDYVDIYGSLSLNTDSAASSDSATIATVPTETCANSYLGRIEWVDDTNAVGAWMYICEKTGASTYGWYRIQ